MINKILEIIHAFNAIVDEKPPGYYNQRPLPFSAIDLLFELEKLGTGPLLKEIERLEDTIRSINRKPIPNLNDLEKYYESRN